MGECKVKGVWPFRHVEHVFSKWSEPYQVYRVMELGNCGDTQRVPVVYQDRKCAQCGFVEARIVRWGTLNE